MPKHLKQLRREAYCSAPPVPSSSLHLPRLTCKTEASRPRAPIVTRFECKAEISSIESVEFVADDDYDVKPVVKIELDPRQLRAGIAALAIRPPPSSASSETSEPAAAAPGPLSQGWGVRTAGLSRIPEGGLGPADRPRRRGRPKGFKTHPRVAFTLDTLPERQEKLKVEERLAGMSSSRQV